MLLEQEICATVDERMEMDVVPYSPLTLVSLCGSVGRLPRKEDLACIYF
jgi:hypothetical protein